MCKKYCLICDTNINMRTVEQIERIKSRFSDPFLVESFLTESEIQELISIYENHTEKTYKNTGPITVDINSYLTTDIFKSILDKIQSHIGPFNVAAGMFFQTDYPHIIHNDDTFLLNDNVYKGITLPLRVSGTNSEPRLCFFNQCYFHGPAKFFNSDADIPTYYNTQVYDYANVDNLSLTEFNEHERLAYLTHLKPQWLSGLSLHSTLPWRIGSALVFDSVRLHCASDFRTQGISKKLGISIFTNKLT